MPGESLLFGHNVSKAILKQAADDADLTLSETSPETTIAKAEGGKNKKILLTQVINEQHLLTLLDMSVDAIVEVDNFGRFYKKIMRAKALENEVGLFITAKTSYETPVARVITEFLRKKGSYSEDMFFAVQTSVHEALANAIVHGSLHVPKFTRNLEDFVSYYNQVDERLTHPEYASRRIDITFNTKKASVAVNVDDEGTGFDYEAVKDTVQDSLLQGRGLSIIEACASEMQVLEGGRRVAMVFEEA